MACAAGPGLPPNSSIPTASAKGTRGRALQYSSSQDIAPFRSASPKKLLRWRDVLFTAEKYPLSQSTKATSAASPSCCLACRYAWQDLRPAPYVVISTACAAGVAATPSND